MGRENIYLSAQKIQASEEQSVSDIYFNAVSVSSDPVVLGSEDGLSPGNIAENAQIGGGNGGGISMRQKTGSITVADANGNPTTAEFQTALQSVYSASDLPVRGDLVSLKISGGTRLVARFLIMDNDNIATTGTVSFTVDGVTYYGLNISYVSLEGIIDAIQDYFAGPNGGNDPDGRDVFPSVTAPFAIAVEDIYDTSPEGFLVPSDTARITSENGNVQVKDTIDDDADGVDQSVSFPGSDGVVVYAVYLKVVVSFSGGTVNTVTATQELRQSTTTNLVPVTDIDFNTAGTQGTKYFLVGTIELARSGDRRFVRISQTITGDVKSHAESTATGSTVSGLDTDAGLREFTICVNGDPYKTFILTGPLYSIP